MALAGKDRAFVQKHIAPNAEAKGKAFAHLRLSGVDVATVVRQMRAAKGDRNEVMRAYALSADELRASMTYYESYKALFDARLLLEDDAWSSNPDEL